MSEFPARIHVLLANEARIGLVIRRGPSQHVATILWDLSRDTFQIGQWLKGRIYERRCDLSPDGKHLIYFAHNGKRESETGGSWTAVSRAPYLKALAIFPYHGETYFGGGLWSTTKSYWLNRVEEPAQFPSSGALRDTGEVTFDHSFKPPSFYHTECLGVYFPKLLRDGWRLVQPAELTRKCATHIFEKTVLKGWVLHKIVHAQINPPAGKGCYWDEHKLLGPSSSQVINCPDWEWADLDNKRLVWASAGKLFAGSISTDGSLEGTELYDCNSMVFEPIEAPY